jgi:hypothetical protein
MIIPRKKKVNRGFKVRDKSIPAPIGGLNARDSVAEMPETDALILDNAFPSPTDVKSRNGYTLHNNKPTGKVETLMAYNSGSDSKLFSVDDDNDVRDVTSTGTGGTPVAVTVSNGRFQYINMATPGGQFLMAVNGEDKLIGYDGANWWQDGDGAHDITGVDTADLIHITTFKSRVWFTKKTSTKAYYLGLNSIAGAAVEFDIGSLLHLGGYLMGIFTWTINDSSGTQEYLVFVSSEGEVLVYQGYDPAFTSTFALAGRFRIGRPVGRRFFAKVGSDMVLLTADGAVPLSKSLLSDRSAIQEAISNKIVNLITADVQSYSNNFGWQVILYPTGNKIIINVPQYENTRTYQYVMNTITNAWCTFGYISSASAWTSFCYEILQDKIYFGGSAGVYQCDVGSSDNGANIITTIKPAFSYFGLRVRQKIFSMIKPYFLAPGRLSASVGINVDFSDANPTSSVPINTGLGGSPWDTSPWDTSPWSQTGRLTNNWQSVSGIGVAGTTKIVISAKQQVSLQAIDYMYTPGGYI